MINRLPAWHFNELRQVGTDYGDSTQVEAYDGRMAKLRDLDAEMEQITSALKLTESQTVLELGCGTGELSLRLARHCKKVIAVDVSPAMLEFAQRKVGEQGITNIEFRHAGFLTYEHEGEPMDGVLSQLALHHLPDFWKQVALKKVHAILKEGGRFFLKDTVYSFAVDGYCDFFDHWIEGTRRVAGEEIGRDLETAIREEYSTCDWIMEGFLTRAGFGVERAEYNDGFLAVYVCTKGSSQDILSK